MNFNSDTPIIITAENLSELARSLAKAIHQERWVNPAEAEKILNLKRETILNLNARGLIDVSWSADKKWVVCRKSIDKYLISKLNKR